MLIAKLFSQVYLNLQLKIFDFLFAHFVLQYFQILSLSENSYFSLNVGDALAINKRKTICSLSLTIFLIFFVLKCGLNGVNKLYIKQSNAKAMFPTICSYATLIGTYLE